MQTTSVKNDNARLRVVIDTNVLISGIVFGGTPERLVRMFVDGSIDTVISEELLTELRRTINRRFPNFVPRLDELEVSLRAEALLVPLGSKTVTICRDPDDNKVIETALIGKCQYIVSGDKDLLDLGSYEGVTVLPPAEFLQIAP